MPKPKPLEMLSSLPSYLGGKRALLGPIFGAIARHVEISDWPKLRFVDAFSGGGVVSLYAKARFGSVLSCDAAARAELIGRAILENNGVRLNRVDLQLFLAGVDGEPYVETQLGDYFIPPTARIIDRGLAYAATVRDPDKAAMLRLLAWRIACLSQPNAGANVSSKNLAERAMSGELSAAGIMQATFAMRPPTLTDLGRFTIAMHKGIFHGDLQFTRADAVTASAEWKGDVWFVDPPYVNSDQYAQKYEVVDRAVMHDAPLAPADSPYGKPKTAEKALAALLANARAGGARMIVWCNSRAWEPLQQLDVILDAFGHAEEVIVDHKHASASGIHSGGGATSAKASGQQEFMAVGYL
jgi:hypothetical protein